MRKDSIYIEYNGETKLLREWAKILEIDYIRLYQRIKLYGWSAEKAFTQKVRHTKKGLIARASR